MKPEERAKELERVPAQVIDKSQWPKHVRSISIGETDGLGVDANGRLYWNGKPVEIIGQRLDLTWPQLIVAIVVAVATVVAALATSVQGFVAYEDWACKVHWPAASACPTGPVPQPPGPR